MVRLLLPAVACVPLALLAGFLVKHRRHAALGLAPESGSLAKVAAAQALVYLQSLRSPGSDETLEAWHDDPADDDRLNSEFWSENLYFWANTRVGTEGDFLYTIRLSFMGPNASIPLSWWTFSVNGEQWHLPDDFDTKFGSRPLGGPREVTSPGLGRLTFKLDKPMRQWTLSYNGIVVNAKTGAQMHCKSAFVVKLIPDNVYHFSTMQDPLAVAKSMSRRDWSGAYFAALRSQKQVRYSSLASQVTGSLTLSPSADAEPVYSLPDNWVGEGSRDHTWGVRKWSYLWRYIWFPPVKFDEPIILDGLTLTYLTGTIVEYGTLENAVVGGLLDDHKHVLTWSGSTPMPNIAPQWYASADGRSKWGERTLPGQMSFTLSFADASYLLDVSVERGREFGLWENTFVMAADFELHEALTRWKFSVRKASEPSTVLQRTTGLGLLEFGNTLGSTMASSDI